MEYGLSDFFSLETQNFTWKVAKPFVYLLYIGLMFNAFMVFLCPYSITIYNHEFSLKFLFLFNDSIYAVIGNVIVWLVYGTKWKQEFFTIDIEGFETLTAEQQDIFKHINKNNPQYFGYLDRLFAEFGLNVVYCGYFSLYFLVCLTLFLGTYTAYYFSQLDRLYLISSYKFWLKRKLKHGLKIFTTPNPLPLLGLSFVIKTLAGIKIEKLGLYKYSEEILEIHKKRKKKKSIPAKKIN